jgi:hypothetical protein
VFQEYFLPPFSEKKKKSSLEEEVLIKEGSEGDPGP